MRAVHAARQMRLNECEAAMEKITDIIEKHRQKRTAQQMVKSQTSPPAGVSKLPKALMESGMMGIMGRNPHDLEFGFHYVRNSPTFHSIL